MSAGSGGGYPEQPPYGTAPRRGSYDQQQQPSYSVRSFPIYSDASFDQTLANFPVVCRAIPSSLFPCAVMTTRWDNKFRIGMNNRPPVDAQGSPCLWMDNTNLAKHPSLRRE
jgi:hypothetical protein